MILLHKEIIIKSDNNLERPSEFRTCHRICWSASKPISIAAYFRSREKHTALSSHLKELVLSVNRYAAIVTSPIHKLLVSFLLLCHSALKKGGGEGNNGDHSDCAYRRLPFSRPSSRKTVSKCHCWNIKQSTVSSQTVTIFLACYRRLHPVAPSNVFCATNTIQLKYRKANWLVQHFFIRLT